MLVNSQENGGKFTKLFIIVFKRVVLNQNIGDAYHSLLDAQEKISLYPHTTRILYNDIGHMT